MYLHKKRNLKQKIPYEISTQQLKYNPETQVHLRCGLSYRVCFKYGLKTQMHFKPRSCLKFTYSGFPTI